MEHTGRRKAAASAGPLPSRPAPTARRGRRSDRPCPRRRAWSRGRRSPWGPSPDTTRPCGRFVPGEGSSLRLGAARGAVRCTRRTRGSMTLELFNYFRSSASYRAHRARAEGLDWTYRPVHLARNEHFKSRTPRCQRHGWCRCCATAMSLWRGAGDHRIPRRAAARAAAAAGRPRRPRPRSCAGAGHRLRGHR